MPRARRRERPRTLSGGLRAWQCPKKDGIKGAALGFRFLRPVSRPLVACSFMGKFLGDEFNGGWFETLHELNSWEDSRFQACSHALSCVLNGEAFARSRVFAYPGEHSRMRIDMNWIDMNLIWWNLLDAHRIFLFMILDAGLHDGGMVSHLWVLFGLDSIWFSLSLHWFFWTLAIYIYRNVGIVCLPLFVFLSYHANRH